MVVSEWMTPWGASGAGYVPGARAGSAAERRPEAAPWKKGVPTGVSSVAIRHRAETLTEKDSDQTLIRGALSNDNDSYARLVERYEAAVAGVLWRFTRDRLELDELVQDTFVEAYFSLRRFRGDAPFFPWLRTIATRVGYKFWQRRQRERRRKALLEENPPVLVTETRDTAEYVYHVLGRLDPKDRLVLTLQYLEGCSTKEVAERMGWTFTVTRVRAFRARKKLRALLELEQENDERH